jgi:CRP-like cAMP-binding protein
MSFFNKKPAMASVVCESDTCNYWTISRSAFNKFLEENPEVKTQIAETLAKREKENKEKL